MHPRLPDALQDLILSYHSAEDDDEVTEGKLTSEKTLSHFDKINTQLKDLEYKQKANLEESKKSDEIASKIAFHALAVPIYSALQAFLYSIDDSRIRVANIARAVGFGILAIASSLLALPVLGVAGVIDLNKKLQDKKTGRIIKKQMTQLQKQKLEKSTTYNKLLLLESLITEKNTLENINAAGFFIDHQAVERKITFDKKNIRFFDGHSSKRKLQELEGLELGEIEENIHNKKIRLGK